MADQSRERDDSSGETSGARKIRGRRLRSQKRIMIQANPAGRTRTSSKAGCVPVPPSTRQAITIREAVASDEVRIVVRRNGPYRLHGPATIVDAEGTEYARPEGEWVHLCRCGRSGTKPFCDGTHKRAGFEAASAPPPHSRTD